MNDQNLINWDGIKFLIENASENDNATFETGVIEVRYYYDNAATYEGFRVYAESVEELIDAVFQEIEDEPEILLDLNKCETVGIIDIK